MIAAGPRDERGRTVLVAFIFGLAAGMLFWSYYRVVTTKFPLVFLNPLIMVTALAGLAVGLAAACWATEPTLRGELLLGAGLVTFATGNLLFKDASVHFLFGQVYYPFPSPSHVARVMTGHVLGFLLSPVPFYLLGRGLGSRMASRSARVAAWCGAAAGLVVAYVVIPWLGGYGALFSACLIVALALRHRAAVLASAALLVAFGSALAHPPYSFFTWQLRDFTRIDTLWSAYYKIDYLSFDDDHCLAGIHNNVMLWDVCDDPSRALLIYQRLARALASGPIPKRHVLSIGRAEGSFAQAIEANDPRLERMLTADYDARVAADLAGRLARYNGRVFTGGPIVAQGQDLRLLLERSAERFDVVYINGAGIMLFFYPLTVIPQEDFLFSAESYRRIFDRLLDADGVFVMDRGTKSIDEAYQWAGSLPADVQLKIFWTKIADYPLTGVSLGYVIASRNAAELDRIARELTQGEVFKEIPVDPQRRARYGHTDDRPFMQPRVTAILVMLGLPGVLAVAALVEVVRRRLMKSESNANPLSGPWGCYRFVAEGIVAACIGLWVVCRGARAFTAGAPFGFVLGAALFVVGIALAVWAVGRGLRPPLLAAVTVTMPALAFAALLFAPCSVAAAVTAAVIGGFGASGPYLVCRDQAPGLSAFLWLGSLVGVLLFQAAVFVIGFTGTAALTLALCCVFAAIAWFSARTTSSALAAAHSRAA